MAVYYKFKSAKDYDSVPIDGHFISVANLKEKIFESKHLGRGTDFDLMVSNAQTNEEYADEAMLIPKNTSVLVRRVPGRPRMPIVTERAEPKASESKAEDIPPPKSNFSVADSSTMRFPDESEWDEFGNDLYAIPEAVPVQSGHPVQDAPPTNKADEDSKLKALIDTPALDWQWQPQDSFGPGRGFGRGMGGRMMPGRGFGRGGGLERKTPPQGYICHRCKVPGHFIQHCPTNGDPNFDIKKVKPPTGIPKSMLMATPDGSYALPSGAVAVLKPNEAAFEKEIEGFPSARPVINDLPPELRCPLCKEVMKDAVLTSKCCFNSFCDKCIRDHIISKSLCVCGAKNILADDLLPNRTVRETINRILESTTSSAENAGSLVQVQDMESARCAQPRIPSPTLSAAVKEEHIPPPLKDDTPIMQENVKEGKAAISVPQHSLEKSRGTKNVGQSEATLESVSAKEATSQGSAPHAEEEVQQKLPVGEQGKKKKKKKIRVASTAPDMQWKTSQDLAAENYVMPFGQNAYNPYMGGMQWGMDGFMMPPYAGAMPPYMGYNPGVFDAPFGGMLPQDPFGAGGPGYMMPVPPRDLSELAICPAPPVMSREEFEARKAEVRRKREMERRSERDCPKERECGRELSSGPDISSKKSKPRMMLQSSGIPRHERASSFERPREPPARRSLDRGDVVAPPPPDSKADRKQKGSVFSRISFPAAESGDAGKKRRLSEPPNGYKDQEPPVAHRSSASNGYRDEWKPVKGASSGGGGGRKSSSVVHEHDYSSDEDYHFKRKRPRHESVEWEEDGRTSRSSRERGRDHEREYERERPPKHHR
eukprot:TRINITY_DN165_c0_g2_i1.p1 TRINITY_DN165_c0_g2~~TRINITY_DN165_c0_g2_i1.p1  ORF type:complete len:823 (-),score=189.05 TRINITY_DN165_c0_g2_i1:283-2751(-)